MAEQPMTEQHNTPGPVSEAPQDSPSKAAQPPGPAEPQAADAAASSGASRSSPWTGVVVFGGIMFIILGGAEAAMAVTAGFDEAFYQVPSTDLVVSISYTAWGWVHLALGALAAATGWGLLTGRRWASPAGIALALLNALSNVVFIRAYPWWSLTAIALDVLIIYAITQHPREQLRRPA